MNENDKQVGGDHYQGTIQHWDLMIAQNVPYMEGQITKYVLRWRKKNGLQDLLKAKHFLEKLIESVEAKEKSSLLKRAVESHKEMLQRDLYPSEWR